MKKVILFLSLVIFLTGCGAKTTPSFDNKGTMNSNKVLNLYSYNPDTLNPIKTKNQANAGILNLVYEPLFYLDENFNLINCLADSWTPKPDGITYDVYIKDNVLFHNGAKLTIEDVMYSLNLAKGYDRFSLGNISSIKKISPYGIEIRLKKIEPGFIRNLEVPIIKANTSSSNGTGMYKIIAKDNKSITLTASNNYWGQKPIIKNIKVKFQPDVESAFFAFFSGEIDVATVDIKDLPEIRNTQKGTLKTIPTSNFTYLALNPSRFNNKNVRKAIAYSINKEDIANMIYANLITPTETFINPNYNFYSADETYNYSLEDAKAFLGEHKVQPFKVLVNKGNALRMSVATKIVNNIRELGIDVSLLAVSNTEYQNFINAGNYDSYIGEISLSNSNDLSNLFSLTRAVKNGNFNNEIKETDRQKSYFAQESTFHFLQKTYQDEMPFISLFYKKTAIIYSTNIKTKKIIPIPHNIYYGIENWSIGD